MCQKSYFSGFPGTLKAKIINIFLSKHQKAIAHYFLKCYIKIRLRVACVFIFFQHNTRTVYRADIFCHSSFQEIISLGKT